jgi:hypothetical protein
MNTHTPDDITDIKKGAIIDLDTRVIITASGPVDHAPNMWGLSYVKLNDKHQREHTTQHAQWETVPSWVNPQAITRHELRAITRIVETRPTLAAALLGNGQAQPIDTSKPARPAPLRPKRHARPVARLQAA